MIKDKFPKLVYDYNSKNYKVVDTDKFLFHHIQKTAGSTMRGILENLFLVDELCPSEVSVELESEYRNGFNNHKLFAGHFRYSSVDKCLSDAIWITFLRNPIARVISHYYNHIDISRVPEDWKKRLSTVDGLEKYIEDVQGVSILEWLNHESQVGATRIMVTCNHQTQCFLPDEIKKHVSDWSIYNSEFVELAKQNLKEKFAFVGIQEYFDLSLDLFSATFALNPIDATNYTTNLNTKKTKDTKYDLDEEVLSVIKEKNQMDLELYEYGVELLFERMHQINQTLLSNNRFYLMRQINQKERTFQNHWDITQVYSTHGFYALEGDENKVFKWSGYQTPSMVEFLYDFEISKNYEIKLEVLAVINESILEKIEILVDDVLCNLNISKEQNTHFISLKLSDIEKLATSKFHTLKIVSPLQIEGDFKGARKLGLALHAIEIIPSKA